MLQPSKDILNMVYFISDNSDPVGFTHKQINWKILNYFSFQHNYSLSENGQLDAAGNRETSIETRTTGSWVAVPFLCYEK